MLGFTKIRDPFPGTLQRFAEVTRRDSGSVVRRAHKGVTRRVIAITPPAHAAVTGADQTLTREAYQAGAQRIARQMSAVMAPRTLKRRRTITQAFGRPLAKPVTYRTKERIPDVAGFYRSQLAANRGGTRFSLKGFKGRVGYVSRAKFQTVLRGRQAAVGRLAAGWASAARFAGAPLPAWVARHGTSGGNITFTGMGGSRIVTRNFGVGLPSALRAELARRIPYAVRYQQAAMRREIDYLVYKRAAEHGLKTPGGKLILPAGMN